MTKKYLYLFLVIYMVFCHPIIAQDDTLLKRSYDYLDSQIDRNEKRDSIKLWMYLNGYLKKARVENNAEKMMTVYKNMALLSNNEKDEAYYVGNMIKAAKQSNNKDITGSAYITKGVTFFYRRQYKAALDNFIIAYSYLKNSKNDYLKYQTKYFIATIKMYLGFYDEVTAMLKECVNYYSLTDDHDNQMGYLDSLHALSICYCFTGEYDLCTQTNKTGLDECKKINDTVMVYYFNNSEGINQYYKKQYTTAINLLNSTLPGLINDGDFGNESSGYFYIGKSYLALGETQKALTYFRKVDQIFTDKGYIKPNLREYLEILIDYYKQQGNTSIQLHYINKLIKADSILNQNFKYLSGKMHKEYDTSRLIQDKNDIEKELASNKVTTVILYSAVGVLFFVVLFLLYRYYTNQYNYRLKFEELMAKKEEAGEQYNQPPAEETTLEKPEAKKPDINPEVIAALLKQLEKFELQKKFLQKDLTLVTLASLFNTNANYLSKVISYSRNKNYITYLNDLRIDYIVGLLKTQTKYRNYTIKALAAESGFSTPQHFSKAFFTRTGIYPSYFVNELNKEYELFTLV